MNTVKTGLRLAIPPPNDSIVAILPPPRGEDIAAELLDCYAEALIITVNKDDKEIGIHHKVKSKGGVLNDYLVGLLSELLKTAKNGPPPHSVYPAVAD